MRWKPRLRTVLLIINLVILLLPLGGIGALRLYESELVRRTESELIAQGTLVGAAYREELIRQLSPGDGVRSPKGGAGSREYGLPVTARPVTDDGPAQKYHPTLARLNLAGETIRPPAPPPLPPATPPDPLAVQAGKGIAPLLLATKDVTLVGIRVVDFNGKVVASTSEEMGLSLLNREETSRALTGEYVSLLRQRLSDKAVPPVSSISRGKTVRVFVGMPIIHEGRVVGATILSRTPLDIRKALFMVQKQVGIAMAVLVSVVVLLTLFTSITINRPLTALIRQAERIVRGEKGAAAPLENPGTHEIELLSQAVSTMAKTLEERADYIRTFAANVSHEFKTPLTSIRGTVELLQDHLVEMSPAERSRFLQIIADDTERLDRLVRRLLDLARADTLTSGDEQTALTDVLDTLADRFAKAGVRVSIDYRSAVTRVHMGRETVESIISNLLDNARQHGGDGVEVTIAVAEADAGRMLELLVRDSGPGISDGNRERIFRPFFTTARDRGGSGLGLSIVQSLVTAHGGTISLEPSEPGACFRIRLPV
ncbi:sensor histidine kinase KdpD [Geobacter sp. AOG1]|uniref:sensor histidine kinase n=1 Tax=Geobacter sp. AOG1 TaxID=1566346 RepID=UPI001CC45870|nr:HAMP domain-containing sensor histidine kinase [Geobacter sp. AOG1]GFE59264.1 two-component sensor histidine kinase [Geobacter sp. AOG1]